MVEAVTAALRRLPLLPLSLLPLLALLAFPPAAFAHRLDECLQATLADIEPDGIRLRFNLTPGAAVADKVLALLDRDSDGAISPDEAAAYAETLKHDLLVRLDGRNTGLQLTASNFPEPDELRTGWGIVQLEFTVKSDPLAPGAHRLSVENRHLPTMSVYLFNAAKPRSGSVQIVAQKRNETQSTAEIEFAFQPPAKSSGVPGTVASLTALLVAGSAGIWRTRKSSPPSI